MTSNNSNISDSLRKELQEMVGEHDILPAVDCTPVKLLKNHIQIYITPAFLIKEALGHVKAN